MQRLIILSLHFTKAFLNYYFMSNIDVCKFVFAISNIYRVITHAIEAMLHGYEYGCVILATGVSFWLRVCHFGYGFVILVSFWQQKSLKTLFQSKIVQCESTPHWASQFEYFAILSCRLRCRKSNMYNVEELEKMEQVAMATDVVQIKEISDAPGQLENVSGAQLSENGSVHAGIMTF